MYHSPFDEQHEKNSILKNIKQKTTHTHNYSYRMVTNRTSTISTEIFIAMKG